MIALIIMVALVFFVLKEFKLLPAIENITIDVMPSWSSLEEWQQFLIFSVIAIIIIIILKKKGIGD